MKTILKRGLLYTAAIAFNRIVPAWLFRLRYNTVFLIATEPRDTLAADTEVRWCETEDELQAAERLTQFHRTFSSGQLKPVRADFNNQCVGAFWCAREQFDENELGVRLQLENKQAWLFSAFVEKSMRGKGIFPQLLTFMSRSLDADGVTQQLAAVNPVNKASMNVFQQNSETQPASVFAVRLLSMTFCLTFGQCKRDRTFTLNSRRKPIQIRFPENAI